MKWISVSMATVFCLSAACTQELLPERKDLSLEEESGEALENVPRVSRFHLKGAGALKIDDIWLVSGDVSSVSQGKLERGEVPQTVLDHREPLIAWVEEESVVLAPSTVLLPGSRYSFVAFGVGLIGTFTVSSEERPVLRRWGPPIATRGGEAFYCAGPPPVLTAPAELQAFEGAPGFQQGLSEDKTGKDFCVRVEIPGGESLFLPPPSVDEFLLEPAPIDLVDEVVPTPLDRIPRECGDLSKFTGGCAEVTQGALVVRVAPGYYFFSLAKEDQSEGTNQLVLMAEGDMSHAFGPLLPDVNYRLEIKRFFPGSLPLPSESEILEFYSGAPAPRFVLTEVLADPLGSEPAAEWVEVMNVGTSPGSLKGLELWDSGGGVALPDVVLEPSGLGLIVREDFTFQSDVVPHSECAAVVVPTLGENGLRNSGEEVSLRTAEGRILSSIPAVSAGAGQSVARLDVWSSDEPGSFEARRPPEPGVF